jgi:hypothetical protein
MDARLPCAVGRLRTFLVDKTLSIGGLQISDDVAAQDCREWTSAGHTNIGIVA